MTAPKPLRLLDIEDSMVVAGTHDVHTALRIVVAEHSHFEDYDRADGIDVAALASELHLMLGCARTEWYRILPAMRGNCLCGGCHDWDVHHAHPGARGAFRVVAWYW